MQLMKEREAEVELSIHVEIDDAYLGGERPREKGKFGRGTWLSLSIGLIVATI